MNQGADGRDADADEGRPYEEPYETDLQGDVATRGYLLQLADNTLKQWHKCDRFTPVGEITGVELAGNNIARMSRPTIVLNNIIGSDKFKQSITVPLIPKTISGRNIVFELDTAGKHAVATNQVIGQFITKNNVESFSFMAEAPDKQEPVHAERRDTGMNDSEDIMLRPTRKTRVLDKKIRSMPEFELRAIIVQELRKLTTKKSCDVFARSISEQTNQPLAYVKECAEMVAKKGATYELLPEYA